MGNYRLIKHIRRCFRKFLQVNEKPYTGTRVRDCKLNQLN